jgi:hypothetical protein
MRAESWVNSGALLNRMNFALRLGTGKLAGVKMDAAKLAGNGTKAEAQAETQPETQPEQVQRTLEQALLAGAVSAQTHETIAKQLSDPLVTGRKLDDPPKPVNQGAVAGLILGSPEFQRR